MTKDDDISNPFEVTERKTLAVENIFEKNNDLLFYFSVSITHIWTIVQHITQMHSDDLRSFCSSNSRSYVSR